MTQAGPDAIEAGVVWRHVRTAEGKVGYLPAGFLAYAGGGPALDAPPAGPTDVTGGCGARAVGRRGSRAAGRRSRVGTAPG